MRFNKQPENQRKERKVIFQLLIEINLQEIKALNQSPSGTKLQQ